MKIIGDVGVDGAPDNDDDDALPVLGRPWNTTGVGLLGERASNDGDDEMESNGNGGDDDVADDGDEAGLYGDGNGNGARIAVGDNSDDADIDVCTINGGATDGDDVAVGDGDGANDTARGIDGGVAGGGAGIISGIIVLLPTVTRLWRAVGLLSVDGNNDTWRGLVDAARVVNTPVGSIMAARAGSTVKDSNKSSDMCAPASLQSSNENHQNDLELCTILQHIDECSA